ncbi:hypothetical protein BV898_13028 [Hypsibius exemplaris]|uniref:Uncharacterized protein n=1 Tax=Hypsibius exemplaris TaxID=2072580 RepID=A0A1W0WC03_HYPEX|nr:hypothetical protein BV898_13028 [Hypsibius exemplaris]
MKFLVVLALAFAVSNAAFTGSLRQQTQPMLKQIKAELSANIHSRNSAEVGLKSSFIDAIQSHVEGVIAQIESTVAGLQEAGQAVAAHLLTVSQQIAASLSGQIQEGAASLLASIQSLLGNLFGGSSRHGSVEAHLNALIDSMSLKKSVEAAAMQVFGDKMGPQFLFALAETDRGFWGDIWGGIQSAWGSVTGGIQGLAQQIGSFATTTWHSATEKFNALKNVVTAFVAGGWDHVQNIGFPAAQQLLNQIAPYYGQLGSVAATAVSSLLAAYTGLTIPPSLIVAAGGSIAGLIQG